MNWDDFLQFEEDRENKRRQERMAREQAEEAKKQTGKVKVVVDKKAEQRALKERIMNEAAERYAQSNKKKYEEHQFKPPTGPVPWLVFDRVTGELYGEATAWRAYEAWAEINPTKIVEEKPGKEFLVAIGYNACRCVLRSDWEAAEQAFRNKRSNGHVGS